MIIISKVDDSDLSDFERNCGTMFFDINNIQRKCSYVLAMHTKMRYTHHCYYDGNLEHREGNSENS